MKKFICSYSIVRFFPFLDTGEFANVGVVLYAPKLGKFGFKLQTRKYARLTNFFDGLDKDIYLKSVMDASNEFERFTKEFNKFGLGRRYSDESQKSANILFNEVTKARESLIKFGEIRSIVVEDFDKTLAELFSHYVEPDYSGIRNDERALEGDVRNLLSSKNLLQRFHAQSVGSAHYNVKFPFVEVGGYTFPPAVLIGGPMNSQSTDVEFAVKPPRVIKPLFFDLQKSTAIIEKGAQWKFRVTELERREMRPQEVFFSVRGPLIGPHLQAFEDAKGVLLETGAHVIEVHEGDKLLHALVDGYQELNLPPPDNS